MVGWGRISAWLVRRGLILQPRRARAKRARRETSFVLPALWRRFEGEIWDDQASKQAGAGEGYSNEKRD